MHIKSEEELDSIGRLPISPTLFDPKIFYMIKGWDTDGALCAVIGSSGVPLICVTKTDALALTTRLKISHKTKVVKIEVREVDD